MSSGRNRDDCPECGYRKPGHKVRCRFGSALAEGRAQAERELMDPQMRALRGVVAEQVYQPVVPTGQGFADMVDRITRAVAEHVGQSRVDLSGDLEGLTPEQVTELRRISSGTVDGVRPHRPVTPEQYARRKWAAEQWEKDNPVTPETAAAALAGWESHGPQGVAVAAGCPGCGAVPEQTRHGRATLHAQACPRAVPRVPGPPTASGPQDPLSQLTCPVRYCGTGGGPSSHRATLHDPHMWGQNQNAYRCPGADVPGPPTASGPLRTPGRYGECPQTERHTAHQWIGGVGDEVRYLCDGEPSADGA